MTSSQKQKQILDIRDFSSHDCGKDQDECSICGGHQELKSNPVVLKGITDLLRTVPKQQGWGRIISCKPDSFLMRVNGVAVVSLAQ